MDSGSRGNIAKRRAALKAEERVERREGRTERVLEVRVLFEISRLARGCLADAYEHVVPIVRRTVRREKMESARPVVRRRTGGAGA